MLSFHRAEAISEPDWCQAEITLITAFLKLPIPLKTTILLFSKPIPRFIVIFIQAILIEI